MTFINGLGRIKLSLTERKGLNTCYVPNISVNHVKTTGILLQINIIRSCTLHLLSNICLTFSSVEKKTKIWVTEQGSDFTSGNS